MSNGGGSLLEIGGHDGVERSSRVGRHEIKAIGYGGEIASRVALMLREERPIYQMWMI